MSKVPEVFAWIDGSARPNPGFGGWACTLICGHIGRVLSGQGINGKKNTNNQMEAWALYNALACLKQPCMVTICTDSTYLVKCLHLVATGVKGNSIELPAKNQDIWRKIRAEYSRHVAVRLIHENAHRDSTPLLQRYCDRLAYKLTFPYGKAFEWKGPANDLMMLAQEAFPNG